MRKIIIGVMGPGDQAKERETENAFQLGRLIASEGWTLLSGGCNTGVMDAVSKGAKGAGGLVVGIIPRCDRGIISSGVDVPIITDMGSARNNINVLSSDLIIACGMGAGTASEIALALKADKPAILLTDHEESRRFFKALAPERVFLAEDPTKAIALAKEILLPGRPRQANDQ
ncbi:MAG: cytochrome [Nitrospiria bacterium]